MKINNKGIGLTDAVIAIAIFMIFSGAIIGISYNIYLQSNFIKRNETATNYIVEVFEYAKGMDISNVNASTLSTYVQGKYNNITVLFENEPEDSAIGRGYTMYISVRDAHEENPSLYKENFVKEINIKVYYRIAGKVKSVSMNTLIKK